MKKVIQGIEIKELKKNVDERGFLCEMLRKDWSIFNEFTMTYMSVTYSGVVRAWHRHPKTKQLDIFCVVFGMAKVVVYDQREGSPTKGLINEFVLGEDNMILLKIPGECWHGFKAIGTKPTLLFNFPTELYNYEAPDEERLSPNTDQIPFDWGLTPGLKHG
jgi:dTDP-4-dehydrorhamnose 3,5-epimerase